MRDWAISSYDDAIELSPAYASAYYNRGVSHLQLGSYDAAIADFSGAIEIDPLAANAYYNRAHAYLNLGDPGRAVADLRTAAHLGDAEAQDMLRKEGMGW